MTPDEAISDLTEERERLKRCDQDDKPPFVAIKLGIEGLERLKDLRGRAMAMYSDHIRKRLPSETE